MSKQRLQPIDFSKYGDVSEPNAPTNTSSNLTNIDFSKYETTPKKKDVTALSGGKSSTDGESSILGSIGSGIGSGIGWGLDALGGVAEGAYSLALNAIEGGMRNIAAGGGVGVSTFAPTKTASIVPEKDEVKKNLQRFDKGEAKIFKALHPVIEGSSDIFTEKGFKIPGAEALGINVGLRVPDGEALGFQLGDGLAQLGLNIFAGPVGLAINHFANTEKNYQSARKQGISEDRSLKEANVLSLAETLMDKFLGAEKVIVGAAGKKSVKVATSEALKQLAEKGVGVEAFKSMVSRSIETFSKEGLKDIGLAAGLEFVDEFTQTYASEGIKSLFDMYQKAKVDNDPHAKLELYDADLRSRKTLVGALNGAFYGGLSGGLGASFTGSAAYSPTIYSSLQNAYDGGGAQELQKSRDLVEKGLNEAVFSNKMTTQEHENALSNLNNIAGDVQSYSQKSTADPFTRFSKFEIENSHIPNAMKRVSDVFTEKISPTIVANDSDVKQDIEDGNMVQMQFDSRENVPEEFMPFVSEEATGENGATNSDEQMTFKASVPASIVSAQDQNTQNKSSVLQLISNAIKSASGLSNHITFDKLISGIAETMPDTKTKEAFALEASVARKMVEKDLRLINLLNESKNDINKTATFDIDTYNGKLNNWLTAQEKTKVNYDGQEHTVESVSYNGQQVKLVGVEQEVNMSNITPFVEKTQEETATQESSPKETKPLIKLANGEASNNPSEKGGITPDQIGAISDAVSKAVELKDSGKTSTEETVDTPKKTASVKPKGTVNERALNVDDTSPEAMVIKFFASGGKVIRDTPKNHIGAKLKTLASLFSKSRQGVNVPIKSEINSRRGISGSAEQGALTIDEIAHKLWEQSGGQENGEQDFLAAVESVINGFQTKSQMSNHLLVKNQIPQNGMPLENGFGDAQMLWEADQRGMTLEEFEQFVNDNKEYSNDRDSALDEVEYILNNIEDYPELLAAFNLSEDEKNNLNELFSEETNTEEQGNQSEIDKLNAERTEKIDNLPLSPLLDKQTETEHQGRIDDINREYNAKIAALGGTSTVNNNTPKNTKQEAKTENISEEEMNPSLPPVPPTPPSDEQMAEYDENAPLSEGYSDLTVLAREESKKRAEQLKKEQKLTWNDFVEAFVNSDVRIKKILIRAAGKKSFVVSLLRNRLGISASINQTLTKAQDKIFKGLNEVGMIKFNSLVYAYRTIQLDQKRIGKYNEEVKRLAQEFVDKNENKKGAKKKELNNKVIAEIHAKAKEKFPLLNHGTIRVNGELIPMTSAVAQKTINDHKTSLKEVAFAKMSKRIEAYKEFGNQTVKESFDAGMISKEVYDDLKDDFYSLRATIERVFDQFSPSDRVVYKSAVDKAFGILSKEGTTKAMIVDTPLLMQTSYNIMKRAIKKNELKKAIYEATVAQGKEQEFFKEAEVETYKDEEGNEIERQDKKGDVVVKNTPRGFALVGYKEGGRAKYFFMEEGVNNKMYNLNNTFDSDAIQNHFLQSIVNVENFGNRVLTGFATRYKPLFFIGNTQMDMAQQIVFTDIWDNGKKYSNLASSTMRALIRSSQFIDISGRNTAMIEKTLERAIDLGLMMDMISTSSETRNAYKKTGEIGELDKINPDSKLKKVAKYLSKANLKFEIAMRLAAYTEVQNNLNRDFKDKNKREPNEQEQYEIDTIAVAQARAYTDFAEKGTFTPKLNMPYLTSSISAFSSAMEYAVDNPMQMVAKVAQMASSGFVFQLAALSLIGMVGEPEDWDDIPDYDKDRNILIPFAFKWVKDKFGKDRVRWTFMPIRVNPTLIPVWMASRKAAEATYDNLHGIERKEKTNMEKVDVFIDAINMAIPAAIPVPTSSDKFVDRIGQTMSRKLFASAGYKLITGYDPYRGESMLSYADKQGSLGAEGLDNKSVEYIYKAIGQTTGASPIRTKAFVETFTTGNHPLMQAAYAITSQAAAMLMQEKSSTIRGENVLVDFPQIVKVLTGRSLAITANVDLAYNREVQENYKKANDISRIYLTQERRLQIELKDLKKIYPNDGEFLQKVQSEILPKYKADKDIVSQIDVLETAAKMIGTSIKKQVIGMKEYDEASILKVTQTPKGKADMLYYMFKDDRARANDAIVRSVELGVSIKDAALTKMEYNSIIENNLKDSSGSKKKSEINGQNNNTEKVNSIINKKLNTGDVASIINASNQVVNSVTNIFNTLGKKITGIGGTTSEKINSIYNAIISDPTIQDIKDVIANPDLILAKVQREMDKLDESGEVSKKIIVPKQNTTEFSLTGGKAIVGSDTTDLGKMRNSNSNYSATSSIMDLNKVNLGYRNRGDYKESQSDLVANFLYPFSKPSDLKDNEMYVGIKDGKLIVGNGTKVKGSDSVSKTPFAQVVSITDEYVHQENYKYPKLETLDKNQEQKLNISTTKDGKKDANNRFAGGATILETPDGSKKYLVRGSLEQVKSAFNDLKKNTNSPYLNMYILDNGSFSTGLFTKDGKSSNKELKAYEAKNKNGGHGVYIK